MKVIATERGYYGATIREIGDEFAIEKKADQGKWMKAVDGSDPVDDEGVAGQSDKPLSRMSKAELTALAVDEGVDVTPDSMTNKEIITAIEDSRARKAGESLL